jgi:hypothetical protein
MHVKAAIEMQKIVMWVLAILVLAAILALTLTQLTPGTEGSLANKTIDTILTGP